MRRCGCGRSCSLPHRQLRKDQIQQLVDDLVRCRTGSLENPRGQGVGAARSLPHRQLRKVGRKPSNNQAVRCRTGSLKGAGTGAGTRTGSLPHRQLRNIVGQLDERGTVRCRTGSLEMFKQAGGPGIAVRCRTGSLERMPARCRAPPRVRCRTGSLETKWRLPARRGFSAVQAVLKTESSTTLSGKFPVAQTPQPRCLPSWSLQPQAPTTGRLTSTPTPSTAAAQSINAASSPPAPAAAPRSASLPHQTPQAAKSPPRRSCRAQQLAQAGVAQVGGVQRLGGLVAGGHEQGVVALHGAGVGGHVGVAALQGGFVVGLADAAPAAMRERTTVQSGWAGSSASAP